MSQWTTIVSVAASIAVTGAIVEALARVKHPRRLFYVHLGRPRTAADDRRATRLRLVNAVVTVGGVVLAVAGASGWVLGNVGVFCPLISVGWLLGEMLGAVRSRRDAPVPGRYRVSLEEPPRTRDYVSVPLQLLNLLLVVVPSAVFVWLLARLPASVPVHWDLAGEPNRFGSPSELWMMPAFVLFDVLLLWGIAFGVAKERWALPEENADAYAALQLERRTLMVRMTEWILTSVNLSIVGIWMGVALSGLPGWEGVVGPITAASLVVMAVGSVAPLVVYLRRLVAVKDQIGELAGTEVLGTRPDGWRLGGAVYYAPEDPAIFVPKRIGIGQTLNFARPTSWVVLGAILVVPILISLVALING